METLFQTKSNKKDFEDLLQSMMSMAKQIKLLIVLFVEHLRSQLTGTNHDTALNKENKKLFILSQLNIISKWVLKFNPSEPETNAFDNE